MKSIKYFLLSFWNRKKVYYFLLIILLVVSTISNLTQVIFPKLIIESLSNDKFDNAMIISVIMCTCFLLLSCFNYYLSYRKNKINLEMNDFYKLELSKKTKKVQYSNFEDYEFRKRYNFSLKCVDENVVPAVLDNLSIIVSSLVSIIGLFYIISYMKWWLWIALLINIIITSLCEIYRYKYNFKSYETQEETEMKMLYARDRLTWKEFAKEVRVFDMYNYITSTAKRYINELAIIQKKRAKKTFFTLAITYIINGLQILIIYGYISYGCFKGDYSIGDFTTLILSISSIFNLSSSVISNFLSISDKKQYANYFYSFLFEQNQNDSNAIELTEDNIKEIRFNNVEFKYENNNTICLNKLNYSFKENKKYGIVGKNGAGKSTLINLLMRLYSPTSGTITINDIDIEKISLENYYKLFSAVLQDFSIYGYSIQENISMDDECDLEKINNLINDVGLNNKINNCPEGLNTSFGNEYDENGIEFSGGEKQKIAICRALYKKSPILILDEPTASLSPKSEFDIYSSINNIAKNKIVFFISHRLYSCKMCDEILVIDNGNIVESGSHEELMKLNGLYKELYETQLALYNGE